LPPPLPCRGAAGAPYLDLGGTLAELPGMRTGEDGVARVSASGGVCVGTGPGETRAQRRVADVGTPHGWLRRLDRRRPEPGR